MENLTGMLNTGPWTHSDGFAKKMFDVSLQAWYSKNINDYAVSFQEKGET